MPAHSTPWIDQALDELHELFPESVKRIPATEMTEVFNAITDKLKESYKNGAQAERRKAQKEKRH